VGCIITAQVRFLQYAVTSFFHFTDRRNALSIREHGGLYSHAALRTRAIQIAAPGGNDWSHDADASKGLDRYVHLCFRPNHPMEYVARQDGRLGDVVYLQIHPDVLGKEGVLFAPDVSNKSGVETIPLADALDMIDFKVLYTRTDWSDPEIQQRLRQAEKYELLVPDHIELKLIRNLPNG
jgi:hypothetical protein